MTYLPGIQRLPSVARFVDRVVEGLTGAEAGGAGGQRRSVIVYLPSGVDPLDVGDMVRYELDRRQVRTGLVSLSDYGQLPPLAGLGEHFRLADVPATCEALVGSIGEQFPEVLLLEAMEQLEATALAAWARLIEQWAQTAHGRANKGEPFAALCAIVPAERLALPQGSEMQLFLQLHYWWGLPAAAELQQIWREIPLAEADPHVERWRDAILPAIAAGDAALLELLAVCQGRTGEIIDCLQQYAASRGWTVELLRAAGAERYVELMRRPDGARQKPSAAEAALWSVGALLWSPEHGVELHPAALVLLDNCKELEHRIWRAQAALVLPRIDQLRRFLCAQLTARYGADWPWRFAEPDNDYELQLVRKDPLLCGLGHLARLLHPQGPLGKHSRWHTLVANARDLRNRLAHYQTVTLEEYLGLMRHVEQLATDEKLLG